MKYRPPTHIDPHLAPIYEKLTGSHGVTAQALVEELGVSRRTVLRSIRSLEDQGIPVERDRRDDRTVAFRIREAAPRALVEITLAEIIALTLARRTFDFLEGTGLKEDLESVFAKLERAATRTFKGTDPRLDRKLYDVNEAPFIYDETSLDNVGELLSPLLAEERVMLTVETEPGQPHAVRFDPYTLMVYKKGLYLVGHSHHRGALRTYALDAIRDVQWLRQDKFAYPPDYDPKQMLDGSFGLILGPDTDVSVWFSKTVARHVRRRRWHPTQRIVPAASGDGIEMHMRVKGTVQVVSWILSFGRHARVLAPSALREEIAREVTSMAQHYADPM